MADQAKQQAQQVIQQTQQAAGQAVDKAREPVKSQLSSQKDRAAEGLGGVAQALRQTAQQLREQNQAPVADVTERAAQAVDGVTGYFRDHDVDQLVGEVENFARREPMLFLGGAFALGFAAARFLKSSGQGSSGSGDYSQSWRQGAYGAYGYGDLAPGSYGTRAGASRSAGDFGTRDMSRPLATDYGAMTGAGAMSGGLTPASDTTSDVVATGVVVVETVPASGGAATSTRDLDADESDHLTGTVQE